jgi:amino-acid N-acetyltransferase
VLLRADDAAAARAGLSIRAASSSDLDAIVELARSAGLLELGIAEALGGFSVATKDGAVVGACGVEPCGEVGLLRTLAVDAAYRGLGLGRALVEATLERARAEREREVFLLTTTAPAFFARLGFDVSPREGAPRAIRETWEFARGCPETAVLMRRAL